MKFTETGFIKIQVKKSNLKDSDLMLSVIDTGIGMNEE